VYLRQHPDWEGQAVLVEKRDRRGILLVSDLALEVEVSLPGDLPLDQVVRVRLISVDLPRLRASFNLI